MSKQSKYSAEGASETKPVSVDVVEALKYAQECMVEYGKYTLEDRAIPDRKDGCKPIHRRVLWATYKLGIPASSTVKCARIVGETIGKYSPHGDTSAYGGLVTLATSATPLMKKQGNFGSRPTGDEPAAYRYTEANVSDTARQYLLDPDYLACTPMVPNYDGKDVEPVYLPAKLPLVLTQGISGIATGAATNIPSFSLESVKRTVMKSLQKGKCTVKTCLRNLEFQFADGGEAWATEEELANLYSTGAQAIFVVPTAHYDEKRHAVIITSYTPMLKQDKILSDGPDLEGVQDVENWSILNKKTKEEVVSMVLFLKKSVGPKKGALMVEDIQRKFGSSISYSIMVTDRKNDGETVSFHYTSVVDLINDWIDWRLKFEKRVVKRLIGREEDKKQRLNWLLWAVQNKDLVFKGLDSKDPEGYLVEKGEIEPEHAKFIYDLQIRKLSKLEEEAIRKSIKGCKETIKSLKADIETRETTANRVYNQLAG